MDALQRRPRCSGPRVGGIARVCSLANRVAGPTRAALRPHATSQYNIVITSKCVGLFCGGAGGGGPTTSVTGEPVAPYVNAIWLALHAQNRSAVDAAIDDADGA